MDFWLIQTGEPLPIKAAQRRLLRTGLLANYLASRGHEVTWWASDFEHRSKDYVSSTAEARLPSGVRLRMLHGPPYQKNLSLKRMVSHAVLARRFREEARRTRRPDLILCSLPTLDLARAAVQVGEELGVPVYLDIRDLWPDVIARVFPGPVRFFVGAAAETYFHYTNRTLRRATGLIGISDGYLEWGLARAGRSRGPSDAVFPIGYEPLSFDERAKAEAGLNLQAMGVDPRRTLCWFAGTFGLTYDLDTVLEAAKLLRDRGTRLQFVLSGDGEQGPAWRDAGRGLDNVLFTGMVDGPSIAWMLEHAQIGLAAYRADAPQGLPNKVFEYMSAGLAIASSLEGEFHALLQAHDFGVHYPAGDAKVLADQLEAMTNDLPTLQRRRSNSLRLFQEAFDARLIYPRICAFLEQAAKQHESRYSPLTSEAAL